MIRTFQAIAGGLAAAALSTAAFAADVIVVDLARAVAESKAGQHISTELTKLHGEMVAELEAQGTPVGEELEKFRTDAASLTPEAAREDEAFVQRGRALQSDVRNFQISQELRRRELMATRAQALSKVSAQLDTIVTEVAAEKKASVMLDRSQVLLINDETVDVTAEVIARLDSQLPTVPVERVTIELPQQPAAQ